MSHNASGDSAGGRLFASEALIGHAVATGNAELFARAVDSVAEDLQDPGVSPWALGMWSVAFGAASSRYFPYSRRGFRYASPEEALRAAIEIGEREALRGVEFGGLYHLQLLMKLRNDFSQFNTFVTRLAEIADSRYTTQTAVVADCHAAMHTRQGNFGEAYRDCERFMAAIEAANEPIIERWPHYITQYQVLLADRRPKKAVELLTEFLPRVDGGAHRRTLLCVRAAVALEAKWEGDPGYDHHLRDFLADLRDANWPAILLNVPDLLAGLLGDALERDIEAEFCRSVIQERHLLAPVQAPARWPWQLKVHLLGGFRLERNGEPVDLGAKPPTRALDILRVLAVAKDHACSLETLQDWLWPDLDGDRAKAACEQALHRLRKLLGKADLIVQREGKLRLAADKVWVDLADWEARLKYEGGAKTEEAIFRLEGLFLDFPGPPLFHGRTTGWSLPVAERVRGELIDLAIRIGSRCDAAGDAGRARAIYLQALDFYPDSARIYQALIHERLARDDAAGAVEHYSRYERMLRAMGDTAPSPAIRALVQPFLKSAHSNFRA